MYDKVDSEADKYYFEDKDNTEIIQEYEEKLDKILDEWKDAVDDQSLKARNILTQYFKNQSDYDGIILEFDGRRKGQNVKSYIFFNKNQLKSATDNIGTYDKKYNDILYSKTEVNDNGNNTISTDSNRGINASATEQTEGISENKFQVEGKTKAERQSYTESIRDKTQSKVIGGVKVNLIDGSLHNDDMTSLVDENKARGLNTHFYVDNGIVAFDNRQTKKVDAFIKGNDVYLRYDGEISPHTLSKHEYVHNKYNTDDFRTIKEKVY